MYIVHVHTCRNTNVHGNTNVHVHVYTDRSTPSIGTIGTQMYTQIDQHQVFDGLGLKKMVLA